MATPRTNPDLQKALEAKLGITKQAVSNRAVKRKGELPMTTPQAVYTIAHDEGIDLSKYLSVEEVAEVRGLIAQLKSKDGAAAPTARATAAKPKAGKAVKPARVTIPGLVDDLPGMSATRAAEAKAMAEVYAMLYAFEGSARGVIERVLQAEYGSAWWESATVPRKVRENAAKLKADENKEPWHGRRGAKSIDYTLLTDLPKITGSNDSLPLFNPIFDRNSWFSELVNDMNVSRRVVAHMNPLSTDDISTLKSAFRKWSGTLKARADLIP